MMWTLYSAYLPLISFLLWKLPKIPNIAIGAENMYYEESGGIHR